MAESTSTLELLRALGGLWLSDGRIISLDGTTFRQGREVLPIERLAPACAPFRVVAVNGPSGEDDVSGLVALVSRDGGAPVEVVADTPEAANFLLSVL